MTEPAEESAEHPVERRRSADTAAHALAGSSPDLAHNFLRVSEGMVNSPSPFKVFAGTTLMSQLLFFTIGLSSMVGAALLIDKWNEGRTAARSFQLEMFKLQTDLEIQKLDRTMIGEGALTTLKAIETKVDAQAGQLQRLTGTVNEIQKAQAKADRKVGSLQAQIRERLPPE